MSSNPLPLQFLLGTPGAAGTAITGVTTGTGRWFQIVGGPQDVSITFTSIGTTSGGTILIEEADMIDDGLGATASQLVSQAASGFTGTVKLCTHITIGAGMFIRGRISSDITGGGKVIVTMVGS